MRVLWSILFGFVLCASLPGCGGVDEEPATEAEVPTTAPASADAPPPPPPVE